MTVLNHYYHIYADGRWQVPLADHIAALNEAGLMQNLDFIGVGIVGTKENRESVKSTLPESFHVIAEEDEGWEHITLREMDFSETAKILYAHTKGAANPSQLQNRWRLSMTNVVVYDWRRCVEVLDEMDTVGCFFTPSPWTHYSGTYWWANTDYLSTLPPLNYSSRWEAEAWIGKGKGTFGDIGPGHPATSMIERGWTYREGTVKSHSRVLGLTPGRTYHNIEVTRLMQNISDAGRHLTVIESHPAVRTIKIHKT